MTDRKKAYEDLRSFQWFGKPDLRSFGHRSRAMQIGHDPDDWKGKPVIGIVNTWSEINQCHSHFKDRVEWIKKGVLQAGGFPIELPVMTLSEVFLKPSAMLHRNFLAMECEEVLRSYPIDGVVLMGGCDKTTPALIMGAVSMNLPSIYFPAGPMLRGNWKGVPLGSGTDSWKYWDELRAGNITEEDWSEVEQGIARSHGHCMTMGTASTMTSIAESIGFTLPGASSLPAPDANHTRMAKQVGRRVVDMVWEDLTPQSFLTRESFENGIAAAMAMGCSTNAIIHVIAMGRRAGFDVSLDDFDRIGRNVPVIANVRPNGDTFLMEDFYYAGGLRAMLKNIEQHLHLNCNTVNGQTLGANIATARVYNDDVIRPLDKPIYDSGALVVLKGNLAPAGCVMKVSAMERRFLKHSGPALVFDSYPDMKAAIDDEHIDATADTVLILRNAGPLGGPGMPEWGMLPIPKKLVKAGVRDMLRISDARMSGTSYGACILHVAPEAYIGGPLAIVETGDIVELDVENRTLSMQVPEEELERRRAARQQPQPRYERGYGHMFSRHVNQAPDGCDFDFLRTDFGAPVAEPPIF
ncbi:MAG: dihydroxy-acid dehydratase [Gammaproteobacteria bacterium]|nr:dihydroxy-acid dehydratase [Gammaproteobacteria bacterium]